MDRTNTASSEEMRALDDRLKMTGKRTQTANRGEKNLKINEWREAFDDVSHDSRSKVYVPRTTKKNQSIIQIETHSKMNFSHF